MRAGKKLISVAAVAGLGGLVAMNRWPVPSPLEVRIVHIEPARILDDSDSELCSVSAGIGRPPTSRSSLYFGKDAARAEARVAGRWMKVQSFFCLSKLQPGETNEALLLVPTGTERIRLHLKFAGAPLQWRFGWWLWRCGIKLPPSYWAWAGWPKAEGRHPHWKESTIEIPFAGSASASAGDSKRGTSQ